MKIIVKGGTSRKKHANANDAKDLAQEARERPEMKDKEYFRRMNEIVRDCHQFGDKRGKDVEKARMEQDFPLREEKGWD